jgi:hypothetical protein
MKLCSFEGCGKKAVCKGMCPGHYWQMRAGKPLAPLQVQYHGYSEPKRFLMRVEMRGENECWPWTGSRLKVRGAQWHGQWTPTGGNAPEMTHRAAWRLFVGPIPDGQFVLHKCDNPACVNPAHLFLGSQADNVKDMWQKNRANPRQTHGEKHWSAKLTAEIVQQIRGSHDRDADLAAKYGVARSTICDIRKRRIWKHI